MHGALHERTINSTPPAANPPQPTPGPNVAPAPMKANATDLGCLRIIDTVKRQQYAKIHSCAMKSTNERHEATIRLVPPRRENRRALAVLLRREPDPADFRGWSPMEPLRGREFLDGSTTPSQLTMSGRDVLSFRAMPPGRPERLGAIAPAGA